MCQDWLLQGMELSWLKKKPQQGSCSGNAELLPSVLGSPSWTLQSGTGLRCSETNTLEVSVMTSSTSLLYHLKPTFFFPCSISPPPIPLFICHKYRIWEKDRTSHIRFSDSSQNWDGVSCFAVASLQFICDFDVLSSLLVSCGRARFSVLQSPWKMTKRNGPWIFTFSSLQNIFQRLKSPSFYSH